MDLLFGGSSILRDLAKSLLSSMEGRIRQEMLGLGFRKWKVIYTNFHDRFRFLYYGDRLAYLGAWVDHD